MSGSAEREAASHPRWRRTPLGLPALIDERHGSCPTLSCLPAQSVHGQTVAGQIRLPSSREPWGEEGLAFAFLLSFEPQGGDGPELNLPPHRPADLAPACQGLLCLHGAMAQRKRDGIGTMSGNQHDRFVRTAGQPRGWSGEHDQRSKGLEHKPPRADDQRQRAINCHKTLSRRPSHTKKPRSEPRLEECNRGSEQRSSEQAQGEGLIDR